MKFEFICENDNIRLSEELKKHVSKKFYKNLKSHNVIIYVNSEITKTYQIINLGDVINFNYSNDTEINWNLYESTLDIRYEDSDYLVVYKRGGLQSIPTKGNPYSLYQEVLYYLKSKNQELNVSILNRLDSATKGLVVIAKNRYAAYMLQPTHEKMIRKYIALCDGVFENNEGIIETFIDKEKNSNKRFVSKEGKLAITNYKVIERFNDKTLVMFILKTGRTHQIRVHSKYINHPIVGDSLYSDGDGDLKLFSYFVSFYHYKLKKEIVIQLDEEEIRI